MDWYEETLHPDIRESLRIRDVLYHEQSGFQDVIIFENSTFGRVLALDGIIQTTEADEFIYHEMLAHMPILALAAAGRPVKNALVIGGGDGGCLREVLRHQVDAATLVEIDSDVLEICRQYLPGHNAGAFADSRAEVVIEDGSRFVADRERKFDVIIVDSPDPIGAATALFTRQFYADCKLRLNDGGVLITQNGVPFLQGEEVTENYRYLSGLFADATFYVAPVPTYNGGFMAFGWATEDAALRQVAPAAIAKLVADAKLQTRYFNPDIFAGAFALPTYIRDLMR